MDGRDLPHEPASERRQLGDIFAFRGNDHFYGPVAISIQNHVSRAMQVHFPG